MLCFLNSFMILINLETSFSRSLGSSCCRILVRHQKLTLLKCSVNLVKFGDLSSFCSCNNNKNILVEHYIEITLADSKSLIKLTKHLNNVSFWCRTKIQQQEDPKEWENLVSKFIKIIKELKKNTFQFLCDPNKLGNKFFTLFGILLL